MPCYHPITAYKPRDGGKLEFTSSKVDADEITIPCGQCRGCRRKRSREWAIRCVHEIRAHTFNCFITLTYNNDNLPQDAGLNHKHFAEFIGRLRAALHREINRRENTPTPTIGADEGPDAVKARARQQHASWTSKAGERLLPSRPLRGAEGRGGEHQNRFLYDLGEVSKSQPSRRKERAARRLHVGYYMCGEYGERNGRPHYHALLFGVDFADRQFHTMRNGNRIDTSKTLEKLWGMGFASVGGATYESARYISEYILKKLRDGKTTRQQVNLQTGEIEEVKKEYNAMSRRPGVGSGYLSKHGEYLAHGWVIHKESKIPPPRYYDKWFSKYNPEQWEALQHQRYLLQQLHREHHTPERLAVQELVDRAKTRTFKRDL